jgi:hypothetical protein
MLCNKLGFSRRGLGWPIQALFWLEWGSSTGTFFVAGLAQWLHGRAIHQELRSRYDNLLPVLEPT